jgi:hypothetical protein
MVPLMDDRDMYCGFQGIVVCPGFVPDGLRLGAESCRGHVYRAGI